MNENLIDHERESGILTLTINRPRQLNALSLTTVEQLRLLVESGSTPDSGIHTIIVHGSGGRAFSVGADLSELGAMSAEDGTQFARAVHQLTRTMERCPVPVIACVDGYALGGGLELALGCDFIWCTEESRFGFPEVSIGMIPGFGGCVRLPRRIGAARAKEMILSGSPIGAKEAQAIGLVSRVFPSRIELMSAAHDLAMTIGTRSAPAVRLAKKTIDETVDLMLDAALDRESEAYRISLDSADKKYAVAAFLAKETIEFS